MTAEMPDTPTALDYAFPDTPQQAVLDARLTCLHYYDGIHRKYFTSPFSQFADRVGQSFEVLRCTQPMRPATDDEEGQEDLYEIRFADGETITVFGHEVCLLNRARSRPGEPGQLLLDALQVWLRYPLPPEQAQEAVMTLLRLLHGTFPGTTWYDRVQEPESWTTEYLQHLPPGMLPPSSAAVAAKSLWGGIQNEVRALLAIGEALLRNMPAGEPTAGDADGVRLPQPANLGNCVRELKRHFEPLSILLRTYSQVFAAIETPRSSDPE